MGPVQVLVVGFDQPSPRGEVLAELSRLREAGIVRLIDVLLVSRNDDGTFHTLEAPAGMPAGLGELAAIFLARPEAPSAVAPEPGEAEPSPAPAWSLADSVPPGSTAAVALIEHIWASPLRDAIQRAGGVALDETWLSPADHGQLEALVGQPRV